jgi:hypothetical protein
LTDHDDRDPPVDEIDPGLAKLAEQITRRILANEVVATKDYIEQYPQWADSINDLLPAMQRLCELERAIRGVPPRS